MPDQWRALHVFFTDYSHADSLALATAGIVGALADDPSDWFFIRYGEAGTHIRVRLGPGTHQAFDQIRAQLLRKCASLVAKQAASDWAEAVGYPDDKGQLFTPGSVVEIDYVPETQRYGGADALVENERLFRVSTAIAVRAIKLTEHNLPARARLAIDLMLFAAAAVLAETDDAAEFFLTYAAGWKAFLTDAAHHSGSVEIISGAGLDARFNAHRKALTECCAPRSLSQHWGAALTKAREHFTALHGDRRLLLPSSGIPTIDSAELNQALYDMTYSQIHMLNNRLGFSPYDEMLWSEELGRILNGSSSA